MSQWGITVCVTEGALFKRSLLTENFQKKIFGSIFDKLCFEDGDVSATDNNEAASM